MGIVANEHRQDNRSILTAMKTNKTFLALVLVSFTCGFPRALSAALVDANALVWAGESKEYTSKPGDRFARFTFWFTNVSASEVFITSARGRIIQRPRGPSIRFMASPREVRSTPMGAGAQ